MGDHGSVSSVLYLSPPVTMFSAWVMFAEPLSWEMFMGLCVSLLGIVIVASGQLSPVSTS